MTKEGFFARFLSLLTKTLMEMQHTLSAVRKHWTTLALVTLLAGGVALLFSALQPQDYSSEVKMLIIQKQNFETDTYLAAKSAEKVGSNLSEVLNTSSFFEKVVAEGSVNLTDLEALSAKDRHEAWGEKVSASVVADSGLLVITAYDEDPAVAEKLAVAVASVMTTSSAEYHGGGESIVIKVVDDSVTSAYPVRPNIFVNVAVAMALGFVLSVTAVFLRADVPFRQALVSRKQKRKENAVELPPDMPTYQPAYSVLEPTHVPNLEDTSVLTASTEPITMYDHLA